MIESQCGHLISSKVMPSLKHLQVELVFQDSAVEFVKLLFLVGSHAHVDRQLKHAVLLPSESVNLPLQAFNGINGGWWVW